MELNYIPIITRTHIDYKIRNLLIDWSVNILKIKFEESCFLQSFYLICYTTNLCTWNVGNHSIFLKIKNLEWNEIVLNAVKWHIVRKTILPSLKKKTFGKQSA